MPEPQVMTVTGPRPAAGLGVVDAHEHLFVASPALRGGEIDDPTRIVGELREARATGVATVVELTPIGLGRRPDLMRRVADQSSVAVIAATGYHRDAHYLDGHWALEESAEQLAARITADLLEGMHPRDWSGHEDASRDPARAGVIKAGASYHVVTPAERRRLEAAAMGSAASGVAIVVHTEIGTCGPEIVGILQAAGVPAGRIVLAHLDRNPDLELHAELAARGVTLVYDTVGRIKYRPDSVLLDLVEGMVAAGHGDRLMLGLDLGVREYYRAYGGGPGLRYLLETFAPRLRRRIGDEATDAILVANPARAYALASAATTVA